MKLVKYEVWGHLFYQFGWRVEDTGGSEAFGGYKIQWLDRTPDWYRIRADIRERLYEVS